MLTHSQVVEPLRSLVNLMLGADTWSHILDSIIDGAGCKGYGPVEIFLHTLQASTFSYEVICPGSGHIHVGVEAMDEIRGYNILGELQLKSTFVSAWMCLF